MTTKLPFIYRDKVRYSDCDMHQHMNHASYFSFFEQARVELWDHLGLKVGSDFHSIPFILASAHCDYKSPAHLGDEIEVHLGITHVGTKSFRIDCEMRHAKTKELLAEGYTVQVMFDYKARQSIPIPEKMKKKLTKAIFLFAAFFSLNCMASSRDYFVNVQEIDPTIEAEIRYYGENNFVGKRIKGYKAPKCLLTKESATALAEVQKDLKKRGLSLKMYDCYRPQRAVNHFERWAKDLKDQKMKSVFYPYVDKRDLFKEGYIASRSSHSRGSAVDLTIESLDMGSPYDFFDPLSHTANPKIRDKARQNRLLLKKVMEEHGFKNYDKEWWHYFFNNEPFPSRYFNFAIR